MALQPDATAAPQVMGASTEQNIYITYVQYMLIYVYCYCLFFLLIPWVALQIKCQGGVPWPADGEIPDKYEYEVVSANGEIVNYGQVHLSEDLKIHAALRWIYNWSVHGAPGDTITMFEETVYFVLKKNLTMSPEWSAQLEVFSVWEQEHQVLNFRLCKENHAA